MSPIPPDIVCDKKEPFMLILMIPWLGGVQATFGRWLLLEWGESTPERAQKISKTDVTLPPYVFLAHHVKWYLKSLKQPTSSKISWQKTNIFLATQLVHARAKNANFHG